MFWFFDDGQSDQYLGPFIYLADKLDNPNSPYYVPPPNSMGSRFEARD